VESAHTAVTSLELQIEQTKTSLTCYSDEIRSDRPRRSSLERDYPPISLPACPRRCSNRPDILQAEQNSSPITPWWPSQKPRTSQCCVSRRLPFESSALHLFSGSGAVWSIGPAASLPLFHAGSIRAGVRSAEAIQQKRCSSTNRRYRGLPRSSRRTGDPAKTCRVAYRQEGLVESLSAAGNWPIALSGWRRQLSGYLDSERQLLDARYCLCKSPRGTTNIITLYRFSRRRLAVKVRCS